jgi:hypothetical protein
MAMNCSLEVVYLFRHLPAISGIRCGGRPSSSGWGCYRSCARALRLVSSKPNNTYSVSASNNWSCTRSRPPCIGARRPAVQHANLSSQMAVAKISRSLSAEPISDERLAPLQRSSIVSQAALRRDDGGAANKRPTQLRRSADPIYLIKIKFCGANATDPEKPPQLISRPY